MLTKEHVEYKPFYTRPQGRSTCFHMLFHEYASIHSCTYYVPNAYHNFLGLIYFCREKYGIHKEINQYYGRNEWSIKNTSELAILIRITCKRGMQYLSKPENNTQMLFSCKELMLAFI